LVTIQRMGIALPVLLVIADIKNKTCNFVCLNDYIDKILLPQKEDYRNKSSKMIYIPKANSINSEVGTNALRWYAKRSKLISAFQRFTYQYSELKFHSDGDWRSMAEYFAKRIEAYDFWDDVEMCPIIGHYRDGLRRFIHNGQPELIQSSIPLVDITTFHGNPNEEQKKHDIYMLWHGLSVLPKNYEDIWREWFLPTYLGLLTSYPEDL